MPKKAYQKALFHAFFASILCLFLMGATGCSGVSSGKTKKYDGVLVKQYGGVKTKPDAAYEKRICLLHPATGEKLDVVYFHNQAYDPTAMRDINKLFRDRTANVVGDIDPELIDFLVDIRTRFNLPSSVVFEILSGYRSPETNQSLRLRNGQAAKESLHKYGYAVDFRIQGVYGSAIAEIAKTMQRGGASFYASDKHVHIDIGNIRTWKTK